MSPSSHRIKKLITRIDNVRAHVLGQPRWYSIVFCDEMARRLLEDYPEYRSELRSITAARNKLLADAVAKLLLGQVLDPVEDKYISPDAAKQQRERDRIKILRIGTEDDLGTAKVRDSDLSKSEAHGRRYRRRAPQTLGLVDLADKQVGKPRLIPAKPFGQALKGALARLTPNQRTIFQGRMLDDPPRSLGDLARELKVSRKRIVVLESRARELMAQFLEGR